MIQKIVDTYLGWSGWFEELAEKENLDSQAVEEIDREVRRICAELRRDVADLQEAAGVQVRRGGRPRRELPVKEIRESFGKMSGIPGYRNGRLVEDLAAEHGVSKRTIYRALATPSEEPQRAFPTVSQRAVRVLALLVDALQASAVADQDAALKLIEMEVGQSFDCTDEQIVKKVIEDMDFARFKTQG